MKAQPIALVFLPLLFLTQLLWSQQQPPEDLKPVIEQLDKAATEMVKDPQAASFTLGLVRPGGLVWTKSYGYADIATKKPANTDTVYRIGSITKQFTALMLLQLVHEGKVHFSDPVEKYFPEIHQVKNEYRNAAPITFLQLANHTSGLDAEPDVMATYTKGDLADWEKTLIAALPHTQLAYEPGTRFNYSNIGYAILGAALSRAAHQPYIDYVKQKILLPLGMTHSDFVATPEIRQTLATGYDVLLAGHWDEETPARELAGRGYKVPNGGLFTTVGDLARFEVFEMLGGPESVLPKKELEENLHRIITADHELTGGRGIGFTILNMSGHVFVGHSGGVSGYSALAYVQPVAQTGIIVLRNESALGMEKLMQVFAKTLEVKSPPAPEQFH
jgi:CubicO group peptidase (beta-lactamase class C family)